MSLTAESGLRFDEMERAVLTAYSASESASKLDVSKVAVIVGKPRDMGETSKFAILAGKFGLLAQAQAMTAKNEREMEWKKQLKVAMELCRRGDMGRESVHTPWKMEFKIQKAVSSSPQPKPFPIDGRVWPERISQWHARVNHNLDRCEMVYFNDIFSGKAIRRIIPQLKRYFAMQKLPEPTLKLFKTLSTKKVWNAWDGTAIWRHDKEEFDQEDRSIMCHSLKRDNGDLHARHRLFKHPEELHTYYRLFISTQHKEIPWFVTLKMQESGKHAFDAMYGVLRDISGCSAPLLYVILTYV